MLSEQLKDLEQGDLQGWQLIPHFSLWVSFTNFILNELALDF